MIIRATFNEEGFATGFYPENIWPVDFPADAIEITADQYSDLIDNQGMRKWVNGEVVEYTPPAVDPVTIIPAVTLWERMTDVEAEQVNTAMATQPFRTRQIFLTANTFRSDHELWPLLKSMATGLFGEERAAELLNSF
ncbi:hypothetical protein [Ochrobactrum sp. RH2CCR150]|uniref:hypothetical protein n=1 Tax=Ochrobactrum sp. RH2CCR150 TaxID=2587044 RepID=UPI0017999303|nr:hypothetical protein [Ochrobactrum sp. RH2CCR150]